MSAAKSAWLGMAVCGLLVVAGCVGGVTYEDKGGKLPMEAGPAPVSPLQSLPRPLRLTVMSVSFNSVYTAADAELRSHALDQTYVETLSQQLVQCLDRAAAPSTLERLPLPAGPEADAFMRKVMVPRPAGAPPDAAAGFRLPDYVVYGSVSAASQETEQLSRATVRTYRASVLLRLVDTRTQDVIPVIGSGTARGLDDAVQQAMEQAVSTLAGKPAPP